MGRDRSDRCTVFQLSPGSVQERISTTMFSFNPYHMWYKSIGHETVDEERVGDDLEWWSMSSGTQVSENPNDFVAPISRSKSIHEKPIIDLIMGLSQEHFGAFITRKMPGGMAAVASESWSSETKQSLPKTLEPKSRQVSIQLQTFLHILDLLT